MEDFSCEGMRNTKKGYLRRSGRKAKERERKKDDERQTYEM
jgi:hypothetical protein